MNIDFNLNCFAGIDQFLIASILVEMLSFFRRNKIDVFYRVKGTNWYTKSPPPQKKKLQNIVFYEEKLWQNHVTRQYGKIPYVP